MDMKVSRMVTVIVTVLRCSFAPRATAGHPLAEGIGDFPAVVAVFVVEGFESARVQSNAGVILVVLIDIVQLVLIGKTHAYVTVSVVAVVGVPAGPDL